MAILMPLAVAACSSSDIRDDYDTNAGLTYQDYEQGLGARPPAADPLEAAPPIPALQPATDTSEAAATLPMQRVSVSVNQTTPLKDLLVELAREAAVDLELDPRIEGGIIFSAQDRPFSEVISRIAEVAGLRHSFRDNIVRMELDGPYHYNYRVDYLSLIRSANSDVSTSATVAGGDSGGGGAGGSGGNASSSTVRSQSVVDLWAELQTNIAQILTNTLKPVGLLSLQAPTPALIQIAPGVAQAAASIITGEVEGGQAQTTPAPQVAEIEALVDVTKLFTINKHAGLLSVYGSRRQHREIAKYLKRLREAVGAQVLIEGKILEVRLSDDYQYGINWSSMFGGNFEFSAPFSAPISTTQIPNPLNLAFGQAGNDLSAVVDIIETFGTLRTLSNPRLTVMHNQTAVLKIAENEVFFEVTVEPAVVSGLGTALDPVVDTEIRTVPIGLVMTVQPSINAETEEITLTIRPTITRVVGVKDDPAVQLAAPGSGISSQIPVVAVQEIDSVVSLRSGQILVMGGLMQDTNSITETGVPGFSRIPLLGNLFKGKTTETRKTELVILLRATILRDVRVQPYDLELYRRFGNDSRPFPPGPGER